MVGNGNLLTTTRNRQINYIPWSQLPIRALAVHVKIDNQDNFLTKLINA